jgi:hypothetical protein
MVPDFGLTLQIVHNLARLQSRGSFCGVPFFRGTLKVRSVRELARREGLDGRSVRRLIPLGFLAPPIVEAIAEGRQPPESTLEALTRRIDLPLLWSAQEQALGIGESETLIPV